MVLILKKLTCILKKKKKTQNKQPTKTQITLPQKTSRCLVLPY